MEITPLHPEFGARVSNIDLSKDLSSTEFAAVDRAINDYSVLIFPGQSLNDESHLRFSQRFGQLEEEHVNYYSTGKVAYVGHIGNIDAKGERLPHDNRRVRSQRANDMWHSDSSFREIPSLYSLLFAYEVPEDGGDTEFASARVAYRSLPSETRERIDGLIGIHDYIYSRTKISEDAVSEGQRQFMRPVRQKLVRKNPVTEQKNFYVGSHVRSIVGWEDSAGRELVEELITHATQPEATYRHHWSIGDLVMWDNRCILHRGCGYDPDQHRRRLHQTRVRGMGPSLTEPA